MTHLYPVTFNVSRAEREEDEALHRRLRVLQVSNVCVCNSGTCGC